MCSPTVLEFLTGFSLVYTRPIDAFSNDSLLRGPLVQLCPALRRLDLDGVLLNAYRAILHLSTPIEEIAPYYLKLATNMALIGLVCVESTITPPAQTQQLLLYGHSLPNRARALLRCHQIQRSPTPLQPLLCIPIGPFGCRCCLLLATAAADARFVELERQESFTRKQIPVRWWQVLERFEVVCMDIVSGGDGLGMKMG